jgi:hypothetical protein
VFEKQQTTNIGKVSKKHNHLIRISFEFYLTIPGYFPDFSAVLSILCPVKAKKEIKLLLAETHSL